MFMAGKLGYGRCGSIIVCIEVTMLLGMGYALGQDSLSDSSKKLESLVFGMAELTPPDYAESQELIKGPPTRIRAYAGLDLTSMYVSRGLVYSSQFSAQPWLELEAPFGGSSKGSGLLQGVSWFVGNWNSVQEGDPGLGQARTGRFALQDNWYETDLYTGGRFKPAKNLQTSLRFNWYTSPSGSFGNIEELDFRIAYNDTDFWRERFGWETFNLSPSLRLAKELGDSGGPEQWYFQPSLTPSVVVSGLPLKMRVKMPLALGFGADGQYLELDDGHERHFGFVQIGIGLNVPIKLIPKRAGSFSVSTGLNVVILSDRDLSSRDNKVETVSKLGITYSF